jgi:hypothetical protein
MFGCLRRIGCLVILAIAVPAAWLTRDRWQPVLFGDKAAPAAAWQPITDAGAAHANALLESLGRTSGPVFANLTAAEAAGLFVAGGLGQLPASVHGAEAAVAGDQVRVRATISLDDIKGLDVLGPFGDFVNKRERIELGGTLDVVSPGVAQLRVESAQIGELPIPRQAIPKLLARLAQQARPAGVAPNGIGFRLPPHVADVRVAKGRVTLYKNVS